MHALAVISGLHSPFCRVISNATDILYTTDLSYGSGIPYGSQELHYPKQLLPTSSILASTVELQSDTRGLGQILWGWIRDH